MLRKKVFKNKKFCILYKNLQAVLCNVFWVVVKSNCQLRRIKTLQLFGSVSS